MKPRNLLPLTWLVASLMMLAALLVPALHLVAILDPIYYRTQLYPRIVPFIWFTIAETGLAYVLFCVWAYLAARNLVRAGHGDNPLLSPSAVTWAFVVPITNLLYPSRVIRALWDVSRGNPEREDINPLIVVWHTAWLFSVCGIPMRFLYGVRSLPWWVDGSIRLICAASATALILGIARAQARPRGPELTEVFA